MNTRRLLVVTYHHPPDPAIGGMRWAGLTKYLGPHGWRSWVLTAAPADNGGTNPTVVSCPRRTTLNDRYRKLRIRQSGGQPHRADVHAAHNGRAFDRLRLEASMLFSLPDDARGWVWRAAARARRLIAEVRPDVVVSSGPPHSAHLATWLAMRGQNQATRWLVDLRDPWAGPVTEAWRESPMERSLLARLVVGRLERLVLRSATGILCNTREFAVALRERYPGRRVDWIPNAVDPDLLPADIDPPFPGLSLAYVGTVYGGRDLRPVLRALRAVLDRGEHSTPCTLRVAGHIDGAHEAALRREITRLDLGAHVELLGVVSRDAALQLAARSRLGIVLAQDQELQVPAKLYELVGMGIPTVVIAGEDSAASSEAQRIGASSVGPADTEGLVRVMQSLSNGHRPPAAPKRSRATVDYREVVERVVPILEDGGRQRAGAPR